MGSLALALNSEPDHGIEGLVGDELFEAFDGQTRECKEKNGPTVERESHKEFAD